MTVIFDFDGTLADSITVILQMYNEHAPDHGLKTISAEEWQQVRRMKFADMIKFAGVKAHQVPTILNVGRKMLKERAAHIKLFPGMVDVVKALHARGHKLYVLSTNSEDLIHALMKRNGIDGFVTIMKTSKLFGKANAIKRLMKIDNLTAAEMWVIGDEIRDIIAGQRVGAKTLAVTWGFHPEEVLSETIPDAIATTPEDIITMIGD
jgi:phosphoglycolate phosphatase